MIDQATGMNNNGHYEFTNTMNECAEYLASGIITYYRRWLLLLHFVSSLFAFVLALARLALYQYISHPVSPTSSFRSIRFDFTFPFVCCHVYAHFGYYFVHIFHHFPFFFLIRPSIKYRKTTHDCAIAICSKPREKEKRTTGDRKTPFSII